MHARFLRNVLIKVACGCPSTQTFKLTIISAVAYPTAIVPPSSLPRTTPPAGSADVAPLSPIYRLTPIARHEVIVPGVASSVHEDKMPFGWGKRKEKATPPRISEAHRARNLANTNAVTNYEADLTSKDRAVQKEAVRRFLAERVISDWAWPPVADGHR